MKTKLFIATLLASTLVMNNVSAATITRVPYANGAQQDWAYTGAPSAYQTVQDFLGCDGNSSYIYTGTDGDISDFSIVAPSGTISAIKIYPCIGSSSNYATAKMKFFYSFDGTSSALSSEYSVLGAPSEVSSYTWSGLNHVSVPGSSVLKIGVKKTGGAVNARVSRVRVEITYSN